MKFVKMRAAMRHSTHARRVRRCCSVGALATVATLVGLTGSVTASAAATKPVLQIAAPYSGYEFFPNITSVSASGLSIATEYGLAYSALYHMLPSGQTVDELATSGSYFKPGGGYKSGFKFTLRPGVLFSDGTPLTARAMVAWLKFYATQTGGYQILLGPSPQFRAVGKWTVKMKLNIHVPNMTAVLSDDGDYWGMPASGACIANPKLFTNATCGTGPYMMDTAKVVPGSSYAYVPNPHYYDKSAIKYSEVIVKVITSPAAELAALEAGQLDLASVGADTSTVAAAKAAGLKVLAAPAGAYSLDLNVKDASTPALANVKVRQAIGYALDRPALAQLIGGSYSKASELYPVTDVPSSTFPDPYTYDVAKAKALLTAAGYPNGFNLSIVFNAGVQNQTLYEGIAQDLAAVGITTSDVVNTSNVNDYAQNGAYLDQHADNSTPAQYDTFFQTENLLDFPGFDPTEHKLFEAGLSAVNPAPDWTKLWAYVQQKGYWLTICTTSQIWYEAHTVTGADVTRPRVGAIFVSELSPES